MHRTDAHRCSNCGTADAAHPLPLLSEPIRVNPIKSDVTDSTQCTALPRTGALLQHKALRVSDHSQRFCACRATAISAGIPSRGFIQRLLHKGESLCCFRDSASVTYGGMLPSDLTLSALRFILSAKSGQSCKQDCETVDFCNSVIQYVKERCSSGWSIRTSGTNHPQLITIH